VTYRVALVASHVIQYQAPFFRLLAAEPELDLEVIFCSRAGAETYRDTAMQTTLRWDLDLLGGYRHTFLRNYGFGEGYTRAINPGIVPKLLYGRYDAAIFFLGWGTVTSLLGLAACRMSGTPVMLFGDSSFIAPPRPLRDAFLRAVIGSADAYLVSGNWNADYYRHYGADETRFFDVPWAIDNERFEQGSRFEEGEREALRARFLGVPDQFLGVPDQFLGVPDQFLGVPRSSSEFLGVDSPEEPEELRGTPRHSEALRGTGLIILYSGKLLPRKDPLTLLRAVDAMRHRDRATVLFLGHGELREELERFARERGLSVHFAGFVNQSELPKHYAAADAFVLPSLDDPRATVVNEAMACGLPVLITDRCGPAGDIVRHGDNGFVFAPGDAAALAAHLDTLVEQPELRERMSRRSREIISTWDYHRGVEGVLEALRATC
jgi:glycosyltransferase involved in cell wall biosynthesis